MEMIIWLAVSVAVAVLVWLAAPHHQRIIDNREIDIEKP
jgi:hypothetical protein